MAGPSLAALIESQLPDFIVEDYPLVTNFLSKYYEALSISEGPQDVINNFEKYLDVDTFSPEILVKTASLEVEITLSTDNIDITVDNTDGFPNSNGMIMIDQEIFLYTSKTQTQFKNCIRGYSAKTELGDLYNDIKFVDSAAAVHKQYAVVNNLSNLLLAALIKNYEEQYTSGFPYPYLRDQTNKNLLVKRIKDFYNVKGTPQSLEFIFQMLFSVKPDIIYPKENVYKASESGWNNKELLVVEAISGDIRKVVGNPVVQSPDPYNPELTAANAIIDNIVGEPYQGSLQYTLTISPGSKEGEFAIARRTFLMNELSSSAGPGDRIDVFSTIGFPERDGRVIIGIEEITYSSKTATQFIIKERDAVNSQNKQEYTHKKLVRVFTKNNLVGHWNENGVSGEVHLRIYGLVSGLRSKGIEPEASAGLEYDETADNYFDVSSGGIPYVNFNNMVEFRSSGFSDDLPLSNEWIINENFSKLIGSDPSNVGTNNIKDKLLSDVSAIYRDAENYYIASSGFPSYAIGPFDNIETPQDQEYLKILPRKPIEASSKNITTSKEIGVLVNGVPILNHKSERGLDYGSLEKITITDPGRNYSVPPTVNIEGGASATAEINGLGEITNVNVTNPGSGYTSAPSVTFTSGSGGQFTVLIQQGEIANIYLSVNTQAQIIDAGSDYTEPPDVFIYDSSGKGGGAFFTCQIDVTTGKITGFTKQSGGFDYVDSSTTVTLVPKSRMASATAVLTRWQYNRYLEMSVDNGNASGIVEDSNDPNYGYAYGHIIAPSSLKVQRIDNVDGQGNPLSNKSHSPILGWAYDGNPIYGSFGYENAYQDVTAANPTIKRMGSSWKLKTSRISDAPSTTSYSLGRFTNDYEFEERLGDLDANNGRFCTTPEFPNGVYAYFMTTDDTEAPTFPYTVGEAFYNVPIEENWKPKSRQAFLPNGVRRRTVSANDKTGELLTSRVSGIEYGPITNVEVHQSSYNFTNEDVLYIDNSINDNGDGLFAAVDQIQGQEVASLSCNTPKNLYITCNDNVYLNHNTILTQDNTGATGTVIGKIEEDNKFVVKNVTGTFNKFDAVNSTTEIYNITFDDTIVADVGSFIVYAVNDGGVSHEAAIGKVLRNVFDKNTVIVELQNANPDLLTTVEDGNTVTIPSTSYNKLGFFANGNGCAIGEDSATIVNVRALSKNFTLLDVEDNIAVLRTATKRHGLAVGDDVIVTVQPDSSISTQKYYVETKKYNTLKLNAPTKVTDINGSGIARLTTVNAGSGFTPSTTFAGLTLNNISGTGQGATITLTTNAGGHVESFIIANKGDGYNYGNILTIQSSLLGGNVNSQDCSFFVDAAGCAKADTVILTTSASGFSTGDIVQITDEFCEVVSVSGNELTVGRGVNGSEAEDHIEGVSVTLVSNVYRFTKDASISFGGNTAFVDSYNSETQDLTVYYQNESDTVITTSSTFLDGSTPAKQVSIASAPDTSLKFRFKKDGETEWNRNITLDIQRTYRYLFDTSDTSLLNRNLKFYENVYKTTDLLQAFESDTKPGATGSFTTFQLGYGIPIDGSTWNSTPVLDIPPKIYYGEVADKVDSEEQFFTLVEDPFAGKHPVFYGYEMEFAYRLTTTPQNEGFTNVQYYTDSLYAVGAIKRVKVISGGKNYTMPPLVPGVFLNKRFRGAFTPNIIDGRIVSVTVTDTGLNYSKPVVLLENIENGANAKFNVELRPDGSVGRIIPTVEGIDYPDTTTLRLYESDVKLFAHGDDIGKLATLEIISSGKDFNNDPTLTPQVNPPIVMTLNNMPDKAFLNGELITQRNLGGDVIASGRVDYWIDGINILRLKGIYGNFDSRYQIYGETLRSYASIQKIFVADIVPEIGPTSTSVGSYSSDRSKLSAVSQKVQDGVYYQDYSYVVKSTISINDWRDFVKRFTHPAGFNLFGEVLIESEGDGTQPETIDTPQSGIKDNGFGAVLSILEPGVLGVTCSHKSRKITQSHVRVDSMSKQRGKGTINYSEQNNVEIEVFDLDLSPEFDGAIQADGTITGTTQFTLFKKDINEVLSPYNARQLIVTLDGVLQDPDTAYTISGSTITFASPPLGPYIDDRTGIAVPGVTFYGKSMKFQDDTNNAEWMLEATNITSQFDGTTKEFDLGITIAENDHLYVSLDGVIQEPDVAFTLTPGGIGTSKITFSEAPRQVGKIVELDIGDATNWLVNDFVVGQTSGARGEIVAKRYFRGNKYLDAANIIKDNASVLAEESVGILDDTSKFKPEYFQYPGLGRNQCIVDLKSVLRAMANDLIQGGNSNTFDAAKEYLLDPSDPNSEIKHIEGEVEATLWAMKYLKDMTILAVRNKFGIDNLYDYQRAATSNFSLTPSNAVYTPANGTFVLTIPNHELTTEDYITIADNALKFSCTMGTGDKTYPRQGDPAYRSTLAITNVTGDDVTVNVGATTNITHTPTDGSYDPVTGLLELTIGSHNLKPNTAVKIAPNSLSFSCEMDDQATVKTYPRTTDPYFDTAVNIVSTGSTFHTATGAVYSGTTGIMTVTVPDHGFENGDKVKIADGGITFSCTYGGGTHNYTGGTATNAITVTGGSQMDVTNAQYTPSTGDLILTIGAGHNLTLVDTITIAAGSLTFQCDLDNFGSDHSYPRSTDPVYNKAIGIKAVGSTTITVDVGVSSPGSAYPRSTDAISGKFMPISNVQTNTFDISVLDTIPSTNTDAHTYVSSVPNAIELEKGKITLQVGSSPLVNHNVSDAQYDPQTGDMVLTIGTHSLNTNESIKLRDASITFSCTEGSGTYSYPRTATVPLTATTGTTYNPTTGIMSVTTTGDHGLVDGDWIKFADGSLSLSCDYGTTNHTYVGGTSIDALSSGGTNYNVIGANYNSSNGEMVLTIGTHTLSTSDTVLIAANAIAFTCDADSNATTHTYPRIGDPAYNTAIAIDAVDQGAGTITVNVGAASGGQTKTYPRETDYPHDRWLKVSNTQADTTVFEVTVLDAIPSTNTNTHVFVSAVADGISKKKDPFHDTAINIKASDQGAGTITINVLNTAPSTNVTPHTYLGSLPGAVISGGGYTHRFISAANDAIISGGNYTHTFVETTQNSIGVYADPYNIDNPVANTFIDAAKLISDNKIFVAEEAVARMATGTLQTVSDASYTPATGILELNIGAHSYATGQFVRIPDNSLIFSCTMGSGNKTYPRPSDPISGETVQIKSVDQSGGTFTIDVGASPIVNYDVSNATYDPALGDMVLTIGSHNLSTGTSIKLATDSLKFECPAAVGTHIYSGGTVTNAVTIDGVQKDITNADYNPVTGLLELTIGSTTGLAAATSHQAGSGTTYNPTTGVMTLEVTGHTFSNGDLVYLDDGAVTFKCQYGVNSAHTWVGGTSSNAITITAGSVQKDITSATYDPATGLCVMTIGAHSFTTSDTVTIGADKLSFTCTADGNVKTKTYPRATDPAYNTAIAITAVDQSGGTITCNVGVVSGDVTTAYPRSTDPISNKWVAISNVQTDTFDIQVLDTIPSTNTDVHTFVSGAPGAIQRASNAITIGAGKVTFTCDADNHATDHPYPRTTDPAYNTPIGITAITGTTVSCNVGIASATSQSTYPRATGAATSSGSDYAYDTPLEITSVTGTTITLNVNGGQGAISVNSAHTFVEATTGAVISGGNYTHTFQGSSAPIEVGVGTIADPYYDDAAYIKYEGTPLTATNAAYAPDTGIVTLTVPTLQFTPSDAAYSPASGDMQITLGAGHNLTTYDSIKITANSLSFSCEFNGVTQTKTYPRAVGAATTNGADYAYDVFLPILKVDATSVTVNVNGGQGVISHNVPHTFQGAGPLCITTQGHGLTSGDKIKITDGSLTFTCAEDGNLTNHAYPRATDPISDKWISVSNVTPDTFEIQCLETLPSTNETVHTFVSAFVNGIVKQDGVIVTNVGKSSNTTPHLFSPQVGQTPTNATYDPSTGIMEVTITSHGFDNGDYVQFADGAVIFRCDENGQADDHAYPRAITDSFTAGTGTSYDGSTGVLTIDVGVTHNLSDGDWIRFKDGALTFTCTEDTNQTQHAYPRYTDYPSNKWLEISNASGQTFDVTVLDIIPSTNTTVHSFVANQAMTDGIEHKKDPASGSWLKILNKTSDTFQVQVNTTVPSSNVTTHVYQGSLPNSVKRAIILTGGNYQHTFDRALTNSITANTGAKFTPTNATFAPDTGILVLTIGSGHSLTTSNTITIDPNAIVLRCEMDANETPHSYPRPTDPAYGRTLSLQSVDDGAGTITLFVGKSLPLAYEPTVGRYDPITGDLIMDIGEHRLSRGTGFKFFRDALSLTCSMDNHETVHTYPRASSHDALGDCVDDVKDILKAIVWNLKYGGNNRVWDAADLFIDRRGYLEHIQHQIPEVLNVMGHLKTILANVIRSNDVNVVGSHGLTQVKDPSITKESNECAAVESAVNTFVTLIEDAVQTPNTFESNVARTIPERWPIVHSTLTANRDLTITVDSLPQCAQVESAINTLFSIVTTTIQETAYNNTNYLMTISQDFPNPNKIQVEMSEKEFVAGEDVQSEATLTTVAATSTDVIAPGIQQKFFGYKHGKYYKLDSIEPQFNSAQTIFELERSGVPFYAERNQNIVIILNGVIQQNKIAYRIEDNYVIFNEPPSTGSACFILYYFGLDPERILLGYNIEPPGTFKKFFKLTLDTQVIIPVEGADCWVSTDASSNAHTYKYSYARGRIYKQNWEPGSRNLIFVEGVTAQKVNWEGGTISITRDRGDSASLLDANVTAVEELVNVDLRERLFNRQDRLESNLKPGDLIQIDGEADTRSIIRAAREALVTSGYDSDTTVGSFFRSYEYEVVVNVGPYSGQIEGDGGQAVARIDAELRYHTLVSSRQLNQEYLPGDILVQYADQNNTSSAIVWQATVKNYVPARKTVELYSNYLDGNPYTDPVEDNFRPGEKIYIDGTVGTESIGLQYLKPGGVNSLVVSKRDNSTYFTNQFNWRNDNVLNKGENRLGGAFVPANASANNISQEYNYTSSIYSDDLEDQISKNYREPPVLVFRSASLLDENGVAIGSPTGGGARANAIVTRGEVSDIEIISSGSGYKVPPQVLFTRGYFVIRKDPINIKNLTTFGINREIDLRCGLRSYIDTIFKGGSAPQWRSMLPLGTTLVFGNAGSPSYMISRTSDPRVIIRKILPLSDITTKRQPQILFELGPADLKCDHKGTKVTQTQCTGGVQGISVALSKYKKTETKLSAQSGCLERQAGNLGDTLIGKDTFGPGLLGPHLEYLESFKFEIQPQSTTNNTGSYVDGKGNTINYTMGDMTIGFFSDYYPTLAVGDFENPEIAGSKVVDPGDTNDFNFMQGSKIHFGTTLKYPALDNPNGTDTLLVTSTAGFPASGGSLIIGSANDQDKREKITYTQAFADRFVGCTRVNPIGVVEKGFSAYDFGTTNVGASVVAGGTGTGTGGFASNINYLLFSGAGGARSATFAPTDLTTYNTVTFSAIRGDGSNGGNAPGSAVNDLMLSYSIDGGTTFFDIGSVVTYSQANYTNWNTITQNIPTNAQTANTIIRIYMVDSTNMTSDQYGVRLMWFNEANTDSYVAGDYIITADLDL